MRKLEDLNKSYFGPRVSDGAGVYVAGFVFMYILQVVLMLVTGFIVELDLNNPPLWYQWVATIVNQGAFVLAVLAFGAIAHKPLLQECKINRKLHWKQILIIPAIVLVGIMAFLPLAQGFVQLVYIITKKAPAVSMDIGTQWWEVLITIVLVSVLPAIGEEVLFRGGVARGLKRKNYLFAILMSGLMFSIFHGNAAQTVHQFFIGMVFGFFYFVTGSLLASMFAHLLNNLFAVLFELALANVNITLSLGAEISIWVVVCIIGFVAMYFLLRYMMKISKEVKGLPQNQDKMAWAKDLVNAFSVRGIKDNYSRFNSSLKMLFDDPCDNLNIDGDIVKDIPLNEVNDSADGNQNGVGDIENKSSSSSEMDKLLEEANKQTISKRKRFDIMALVVAVGIALAVWIINLF